MPIRKPRKVRAVLPTKSIQEEQGALQKPIDSADMVLTSEIKEGDYVFYDGRVKVVNNAVGDAPMPPWLFFKGDAAWTRFKHGDKIQKLVNPDIAPQCLHCMDMGVVHLNTHIDYCSAVGCKARTTEHARQRYRKWKLKHIVDSLRDI